VACWIALLRADRCILAGDHKQLPPTIISERLVCSCVYTRGLKYLLILSEAYSSAVLWLTANQLDTTIIAESCTTESTLIYWYVFSLEQTYW